jgi:hypothetical protein
MSERMIPLRIADMAVEACNKEIQELREENARLRASSFVTAVPVEQYERLIKAGDAMADAINEHRHGKGGAWGEGFIVRENWKTAKGGQPRA